MRRTTLSTTRVSRRFILAAAIPAAATILAACGGASPSTPTAAGGATSAPASGAATAPANQPVPNATPAQQTAATQKKTFSFQSFTGGSQDELWNGYNFSTWRKQFPDIEIKFSWFSYGAYKDKMPAQIASGDIPEVMMVNAINDIPLLMANDMIIPLTDYLKSDGPDLMKRTPPDYFATATYNGQHMYMPATWNPNLWIPAIRTDWLQKLQINEPESLSDYETVLDAFTNKDPDGNGKKDTWGYEINTALYFDDFIFHAFGVAVGHHHNGFWRKRGNNIESDWVQPGMRDALAWWATQYKKGVFAPTSLTGDITSHNAFGGGTVGLKYTSGPSVYETQVGIQAVAKNATLKAIDPPKGPGGQGCSGEGMQWGYCISKKAKFPSDVVKMFNWQFTPDGWNKLCAGDDGVPGLTIKGFTPEGYYIRYTPEEQQKMPDWNDRVKKATDQTLYMCIRHQNFAFWQDVPDQMTKYYQNHYKETTPQQDFDGEADGKKWAKLSLKQAPVPSDKQYFPTLQTKFQEVLSQIASGAAPVDSAWNEWLNFWKSNGGPKITEEVNKANG